MTTNLHTNVMMRRVDRTPRASSCRYRAFTLVELLVVIAIISLLVSILLPAMAKAREIAKMAVCKSNMKNIGLGVPYYAKDYDDYILPGQTKKPTVSGYWYWPDMIVSYCDPPLTRSESAGSIGVGVQPFNGDDSWLEFSHLWDCPGIPPERTASGGIGGYDYLWNGHMSWSQPVGYNPPKRLDYVHSPSDWSQFIDGRNALGSPGVNPILLSGMVDVFAPHMDKSNLWFLDGHIEMMSYDDMVDYATTWSSSPSPFHQDY